MRKKQGQEGASGPSPRVLLHVSAPRHRHARRPTPGPLLTSQRRTVALAGRRGDGANLASDAEAAGQRGRAAGERRCVRGARRARVHRRLRRAGAVGADRARRAVGRAGQRVGVRPGSTRCIHHQMSRSCRQLSSATGAFFRAVRASANTYGCTGRRRRGCSTQRRKLDGVGKMKAIHVNHSAQVLFVHSTRAHAYHCRRTGRRCRSCRPCRCRARTAGTGHSQSRCSWRCTCWPGMLSSTSRTERAPRV